MKRAVTEFIFVCIIAAPQCPLSRPNYRPAVTANNSLGVQEMREQAGTAPDKTTKLLLASLALYKICFGIFTSFFLFLQQIGI